MNALRSIYSCAKHQDVADAYVSLPVPEQSEDQAWIAQRSVEQQTLPEPPHGES